ncbi:MAG: TonB-dependent receptor [Luteolibacter sp.]
MQPTSSPRRGSYRSALALLALMIPATVQAENPENRDLETLIVSALKVPRDSSAVTSAVTVLSPEELENQGILQLQDALNASPGVISTSTSGQTGAISSLFIRGTKTADSQIVVDGVRMSDGNVSPGNFLSSSRVYHLGNLEVLRGPQSAFYGGEAIGGVLWLETPRGSGKPGGSVTVEGGSFDSISAHARFQGEIHDVSYFLSGGYEQTANDSPGQKFYQGSTALRVEGKIDSVWTLGTTFRSIDNRYEASPLDIHHYDAALATVYLNGKISDRWTTRFRIGHQKTAYDQDVADPMYPFSYNTDFESTEFATEQEVTLAENLRWLSGAFYSEDSFQNSLDVDHDGERYGVHTALEWDVLENLTATAAIRWEDYDSYGDELTWRLGSVYTLEKTGTSFRAGIGKAFNAPTYSDLFGSTYSAPNPDLDAQSSIGWDIGIGQRLGKTHNLTATWFNNRIKDAFTSVYDPLTYTSTTYNVDGKTTTRGLEVGLDGQWEEAALRYRLAWTHLDKSLADQPRNAATASLDWKPTEKSLIGIGATHLASRSWGGNELSSYTVARIYGSYQITDHVKFHARVENALDKDYQLASFGGSTVEGASTGLYAGFTFDW